MIPRSQPRDQGGHKGRLEKLPWARADLFLSGMKSNTTDALSDSLHAVLPVTCRGQRQKKGFMGELHAHGTMRSFFFEPHSGRETEIKS